jgi:hypothetical protein
MRAPIRSLGLAVLLGACGDVCVIPPCALGTAIRLTVTSAATSAPLSGGVFVNVLPGPGNQGVAPAGCLQGATATCSVLGEGGSYQLEIGAPGFQTVRRTVNVPERVAPKCGCSGADTQQVDIALVPAQ